MKVTLFIPVLNEIEGVKVIMPRIKREWVHEIIVVDGHSTDGTREYFEENGFRVITQKLPGSKGAWWTGFATATGDIIIPFSPDNNSIPELIPVLIDKMQEGHDMVIASRYKDGAKSYDDDFLSAWANFIFNKIINFLFWSHYTDALVMYRAFRRDILAKLGFNKDTGHKFNIYNVGLYDVLLSIRCAKMKLKVTEIPGDEPDRIGQKGSRAHPSIWRKSHSGILMLFHILKEYFSKE